VRRGLNLSSVGGGKHLAAARQILWLLAAFHRGVLAGCLIDFLARREFVAAADAFSAGWKQADHGRRAVRLLVRADRWHAVGD
jgi:hypothetical protein